MKANKVIAVEPITTAPKGYIFFFNSKKLKLKKEKKMRGLKIEKGKVTLVWPRYTTLKGEKKMEIKLVCSICKREILHDVEVNGDDVVLEIYLCSPCQKIAYNEGWTKGVAEYLNTEAERREEDGKSNTTK